MSFDFSSSENEQADTFATRYEAIEAANRESFYMNDPNRTLDVFMSVHDTGGYHAIYDPVISAQKIIRAGHPLAGNLSNLGAYGPQNLSTDERIEDAHKNMERFFEDVGIDKTSVYILNPERDYSTPLHAVDVDTQIVTESVHWPLRLEKSGDFIYTHDPHKILAGRPADCPIMFASADTPEGKIYMLVHYAWQGAALHYVAQTAKIFDSLGVDRASLQIYLTPGGRAESFPYENYPKNPLEAYPGSEGLFVNVARTVQEGSEATWNFNIDIPKFIYTQVINEIGVDPTQVFCDTSDTAAFESGYSSHGRSIRLGQSNTRDIVAAVFH